MATRTITVGTAGVPLDREVGGTDLSTDRTAAEMRTALALGTAAVADDGDFASATRTVGTGLGTSGTVNLDMAAVHGTIQTIAASGTITFTTSNRAAGREVTLVIAAGGSSRTLAWPSWLAVGAALPTTLASGNTLVATVTFMDTTDAAAIAAAAVAAKTPPVLAGQLTHWWASDLTGFANGDPVGSWADRVAALTLTASGGNRPLYRTAHIGGRPAVDFDGTDDCLAVSNTVTTGTDGCITAVVLLDTATATRSVWSSADNGSTTRYILGAASLSAAGGRIAIEQASGISLDAQVRGDTTLSTGTPYLLEWSSDGSAYTFRVNGVVQTLTALVGSNSGRWFDDTPSRDMFALGALRFDASTITAVLDGAIAHFQQLAAPMSLGDRANFHAWVSAYYGIAVS